MKPDAYPASGSSALIATPRLTSLPSTTGARTARNATIALARYAASGRKPTDHQPTEFGSQLTIAPSCCAQVKSSPRARVAETASSLRPQTDGFLISVGSFWLRGSRASSAGTAAGSLTEPSRYRSALEAPMQGRRPNQRMKLSWRGGRLKGKGSVLIAAAAPRSLCAIR
jgi:hypothetical protein